ncbi:hypothetical protein [Actinomyces sp. 565]|uniref:hypothetical protein n=1 Tax=Actinomyces sp. 565 TaxID=2057794 RepID=UPI0013A70BBC|nr:hypothetical protein [Actinomyces sp. 565]NDR54429.1 hypothetical protein [Actinomyces sp. 565]
MASSDTEYRGMEMEATTLFVVSQHFGVPADGLRRAAGDVAGADDHRSGEGAAGSSGGEGGNGHGLGPSCSGAPVPIRDLS